MPPIDYSQLATKQDLAAIDARLTGDMRQLRAEFGQLRGEFAELRGEFAELRGDLKSDQANLLKGVLAGQVTTMMMLGAWVTAVT